MHMMFVALILMALNRVLSCGALVLSLAEAVDIDSRLGRLNVLIDCAEPERLFLRAKTQELCAPCIALTLTYSHMP